MTSWRIYSYNFLADLSVVLRGPCQFWHTKISVREICLRSVWKANGPWKFFLGHVFRSLLCWNPPGFHGISPAISCSRGRHCKSKTNFPLTSEQRMTTNRETPSRGLEEYNSGTGTPNCRTICGMFENWGNYGIWIFNYFNPGKFIVS